MFRLGNCALVTCCLSLSLASCVTPYGPQGFRGGVTATQLNERVFSIYSSGNGFTSRGRIDDYAILKASDECIARGFSHFVKTDEIKTTDKSVRQKGASYDTDCSGYGNRLKCSTTSRGGGTREVNKARNRLEVYMFRANEEKPSNAYSCKLINESLSKIYK